MSSLHEGELELELESELEGELELEGEGEGEGEQFFGAIGNVLGSLLGESEGEGELEGELELELEGEGELEGELELESGEQFFGKIGKFIKKAAPVLKKVARVAAPMVAKAVGGPFGGILSSVAGKLLKAQELEGELELEGEGELEGELELGELESGEMEVAHEISSHAMTEHEAIAEMMAAAASQEMGEFEAEAMAGAAAATVISSADRRALRRILPHLVRGTAILTRILRRNRVTRPAVRAVPTIMRRTVKSLKRQAASGQPITRRRAARTAATQVRRVLSNPRACTAAIARNVRTARAVARPRAQRVS